MQQQPTGALLQGRTLTPRFAPLTEAPREFAARGATADSASAVNINILPSPEGEASGVRGEVFFGDDICRGMYNEACADSPSNPADARSPRSLSRS